MKVKINDLSINYLHKGKGQNIIMVPGWGRDYSYFKSLINELSKNYSVYAINLPGFGSDNPTFVYNTRNYSIILDLFIKELDIVDPIFIGHSFGGKVIIDLLLNNKYDNKVILIDSAGVKAKKSVKLRLRTLWYKLLKRFIIIFYKKDISYFKLKKLRNKYGSIDYNNCVGMMRDTFVTVLKDNYDDKLCLIKNNILLIWGEYDKATPLSAGMLMKKKFENASLKIISKADHFPFISNYSLVLKLINDFIK